MRIEARPRERLSASADALVTVAAVAAAMAIGAIAMAAAGMQPWRAYAAIVRAAFLGGAFSWSDTAVKAIPLILCSAGCVLAFRAGLWNVGAEGQLLLGAWAATGVASFWTPPGLSAWIKIPLLVAAGGAAGAFWGAIPGILKERYKVSEILSSLMLVYVAVQWNTYWIYAVWSEGGFQLTPLFPENAWLPRISDLAGRFPSLAGLTVHAGIFVALGVAALLGILTQWSKWGVAWRAMGDNPGAAKAAGMNIAAQTVLAMALSGAAAGVAGAVEVSGVVHRLQERFSPGFGFMAITIGWLARLNPWAAIVVSVLFGGLLVGSREVGSQGISNLLQGIILIAVIMSEWFRRNRVTIKWGGRAKGAAE